VGLLWGIEFVTDKKIKHPQPTAWDVVYKDCLRNGLRILPNRVRPPLSITKAQLHKGLDILKNDIKKADAM
jgi:4-aminobutyrate aminotransferase-like enzyme